LLAGERERARHRVQDAHLHRLGLGAADERKASVVAAAADCWMKVRRLLITVSWGLK